MRARVPDGAVVADLVARIRGGPFRFGLQMKLQGGGLYQHESLVEPRLVRTKYVPRRGDPRAGWRFGDPHVDVLVKPGGPIVTAEAPRDFATLEEAATAILVHDRALAEEREWQGAAPRREVS